MLKHLFAFLAAAGLVLAPTAGAETISQDYEPRPAIWLLSDADTKIYLLGTVHILPQGFRWQSRALDRTITEASELIVETYTAPGEHDGVEMLDQMMLAKSKPILDRVPNDKRQALREAIARTPLPIEAFDHMRSWTAAFIIGMSGVLGGYGAEKPDDAPGVEDVLEARFRDAGKPIGSIEDFRSVLSSFRELKPQEEVQLLVDAITEADAGAEGDPDIHNWAQGKVDTLAPELAGFSPALFDILLTRRNRAWTGWLIDRLDKPGTILVAVGAAHLAGDASVQNMLSARGFTAKRVE